MKFLFVLLGTVLFLGTMVSLHLAPEAWFFLPLFTIATYHLYRVNYSEGFFVVFNTKEDKAESVKIRLGPSEIGSKDEGDRKEEKFLALFDWRRKIIRNVVSWFVFGGTIWLYFFRLRMEVNPQSVFAMVSALFVMRSLSVGHLLFPLIINLFLVLLGVPDYGPKEKIIAIIYGALFVLLLALIYPSEDRLGKKIKDWRTGKWLDVGRTALVLLTSLVIGLYLLPEKFKKSPPVPREEVEIQQKELRNIESKIRGMRRMGLMKRPDLQQKARNLAHDLEKFSKESEPSQRKWAELQKVQKELSEEVTKARSEASSTRLTPELLEKMTSDLRERSRTEVDPLLQERMEALLKRMENYKGTGGKELIGDYQEMKFGNKGYYREETDFQESGSISPDTQSSLEKIKSSSVKKKEISEKLEKNIESLKSSSDDGLLSVNKALKDELEAVDSMSSEEKSVMNNELRQTQQALRELSERTKNPAIQEKLNNLMKDNQHLHSKLTPHMKADDKSEMAGKILKEKKALEEARAEVRQEIESQLEKNASHKEDKPEVKRDYSGLIRLMVILAGGMLFFWFLSRFRKKGVKKVSGISDELKEEIEERLREVKKKKLSPREEVIETYNILHDGLHGLVFTGETPPSCIVFEGISAAEPELHKPMFTVTETFATTLYGEHDVSTPALKSFRKDITKVFSYFDIRA